MKIELTLIERLNWTLFKKKVSDLERRIQLVGYIYNDSGELSRDYEIMMDMRNSNN